MRNSIQNQWVLITGASSGIGKACAELFAELGVHLVLTARRMDRLETLGRELSTNHGIKCLPIQLDVQKSKEIEMMFKRLNQEGIDIDILVNNAGLALDMDKLQEGNIENWDKVIDTNIKGLLYMTRAALPSMIKKNQGHIINIGSIAGRWCYPGGNVYSATKYAVKGLSESLRMDLFGTAIRVSEIAPGAVETEFSEVRFGDKERAKKLYAGFEPLTPADIADGVIYCATRPPHVNVSELVMFPQAQASITQVFRK